MWVRLDDALASHPKFAIAGEQLGKTGRVTAIGFYVLALTWSAQHLSDGYVPDVVIAGWKEYTTAPARLAKVLHGAGLFERVEDGYRVHDYHHYNPSAAEVKARREADRKRKATTRGNGLAAR